MNVNYGLDAKPHSGEYRPRRALIKTYLLRLERKRKKTSIFSEIDLLLACFFPLLFEFIMFHAYVHIA